MDTTSKILNLKKEIEAIQSKRVNSLLSLCDSQIEKLFLINIIHHVISLEMTWKTEFRLEVIPFDPGWVESEPNKYSIDYSSPDYEKLKQLEEKGIIIVDDFFPFYYQVAGFSFKEIGFFDGSHISYKVIPQYQLTTKDNNPYRPDFAIFTTKVKDGKAGEEYKICIECDGHDFHKSKEQRTRDEERAREIMRNGWKVVRYTGTEIFLKDKKSLIVELLQLVRMDHF